MTSRHGPFNDSMLTTASKRVAQQPKGSLSGPAENSIKRIRASDSVAPLIARSGTSMTTVRTAVPAQVNGSPGSSGTRLSKDAPLEPSAAPQQIGPPPVDPEDNQYIVRRLLKRRVHRCRGRKVVKYLVEWKGYGAEHNSWVCEVDIHLGLIGAFNASLL